jgi:hypothetical protein
MRPCYRFLAAIAVPVFLLCLSVPVPATAQGYLQLAPDEAGNVCAVVAPGPNELLTIHVLMRYSPGTYGIRFAAPVPANSGLTHIADISTFTLAGNSQSDLSVGTDVCLSGTVVMASMLFLQTAAGDANDWYTPQSSAIYLDCSVSELPMPVGPLLINSDADGANAKLISPPDGATNVSLTPSLVWNAGFSCYPHGGPTIYFGTDPDPPSIGCCWKLVGPLEPFTTYYWKVADPGASSVWSFTTTDRVAVKPSTWGSIKAMYR